MKINDAQKNIIHNYINNNINKAVTKIDFKNKKVEYNDLIHGANRIKSLSGDEEIVRAYILTKLTNELGYSLDKITIEYEYTAGRPHTNTSRIDIIVRDKNDNAFLFIELKSPKDYQKEDKEEIIREQLFKVASMEKAEGREVQYIVLYSISFLEEEIKDECMIIDNTKYNNFNEWEKDRNYLEELPTNYGKIQKTPYIKNGKKDLEKKFTHEMLKRLENDLHNVLWGGGGTDDNEIFSSLTNLILAKIQDEDEKRNNEMYDFQSLSFVNGEYEDNEVLFERINELYRRALKQKMNVTNEKELEKSYVIESKRFSLSKLKYTVQQLEKYSFVDGKNSISGKDILGDFFEGIIRNGFKQSKGQFFTHISVVNFMLWAVQADKLALETINKKLELPYLIDPSAGSGTFLIEYMKFITENIKYKYYNQIDSSRGVQNKVEEWFYPDHRENKWAREYIYGSELNFNLGTATKVNMILHGDGSTNIFVKDGLLPFNKYVKIQSPNALNQSSVDDYYPYEINNQFDLILSNPPFSVDLDKDTEKRLKNNFIYANKKNSENLFIERYYQLLKENGRLAVVLPESILDTTENKYIRLFLYKYFKIKAIVSLPQSTFAPFTNTKTSIIFAQKKTSKELDSWNKLWEKYSHSWNTLKTRTNNIIDVFYGKKKKEKLSSIKELTEREEVELLLEILSDNIMKKDLQLYSDITLDSDLYEYKKMLIKKYSDDFNVIEKFDKDTQQEFGKVNTWWVFNKVSKHLNYEIFMAEAESVGYKRTSRGERKVKNDLYRVDEKNNILVDDDIKNTILDYMRDLEWDGDNSI
ncbi:N-6 DNA methylase [Macrococcoides caseolyticum]|nr:restriction endonuclease subunit M [Macrococcus caseolyticus]RKO14099.1 restriction endonuclease subunit M [Macrococcus caseolyticus]